MKPFDLMDELRAAFSPWRGWRPTEFVCWAYAPFVLEGQWVGRGITRELRAGRDMTWVRVQTHEVGSTWERQLTRRMRRAGFERMFHHVQDEKNFRRAWGTARERDRELAFLDELGTDGTPARWPQRAVRKGTGAHLDAREVVRALDAARSGPTKWHEASLIIERQAKSEAFSIIVAVLGTERTWKPRDISVIVTTRGDDRAMNAAWRIMRANGFSGGTPAQRWFGMKDVRGATRAKREAERIFELLYELRRR